MRRVWRNFSVWFWIRSHLDFLDGVFLLLRYEQSSGFRGSWVSDISAELAFVRKSASGLRKFRDDGGRVRFLFPVG